MKKTVKNVAASVHDRLLAGAHQRREDFTLTLQRYAAERFLYRLGESRYRDQFVLKGAMLFALWGGAIYRPTRDLDFAGYGSSEAEHVIGCFREICALAVEDDGLVFDDATLAAEPIRDDAEYDGLRVRFQATLGTARIPMQIDVGFGNAIEPPANDVEYPTLLDLPAPRIRAYPHEAVVAEKLHAMLLLGERTSRFKDFYDLYVLARQFPFDGQRLARAIAATFERRRTSVDAAQPAALTPRFFAEPLRAAQWRTYLDRNRLPGAPANFDAVGELLRAFLGPPWSAIAGSQAFESSWQPEGPWGREETGPRSAETSATPTRREDLEPRAVHVGGGVVSGAIEERAEMGVRRFKPYPEYKDSDVKWLGEIPAHWEVKRLKFLASINDEALPEDTDPNLEISYVDIGNVDSVAGIVAKEAFIFENAPSRARRIVRHGDVIVSTVRTYLRAIAPIRNPEPNLIASTGFAVIRPNELQTSFAAYALRVPYFVDQVVANSVGVSYPAINASEMACFPIVRPSVEEQRAIAGFLDRETGKIDALVAKKERLIELLREKRTALITRAVTKSLPAAAAAQAGLDPNVPMKDSGVEWLGEIPAHWEVAPVYARYEVALGKMLDVKRITGDHLAPYLRNVDVQWDHVSVDDLPGMDFAPSERTRYLLRPGDLLVCEGGEVGRTAIWRGEVEACFYQKAIHRVRPISSRDRPRFFYYVMHSAAKRGVFVAGGNPNTIDHLTAVQLRHYRFPFPPAEEQEQIACYLDVEASKLDTLIDQVSKAIERLKELRIALISAAVTGKIDVREEAA